MIPRFIIKNIPQDVVTSLQKLGYTCGENTMPKDVLVLGTNLLQAPPLESSPLLKVYDFTDVTYIMEIARMRNDIFTLADIQRRWTNNTIKTELVLGDPPRGKVTITTYGVMIDSCIIPIEKFEETLTIVRNFKSTFIASHKPLINPERPFITVGCADYSIKDIEKIITTYKSLLPSP